MSRTFHFVVAVWGDEYIDTFLDVALPSFLSPKNLPACSEFGRLELHCYTRPQDQTKIENHPAWARARQFCYCVVHSVLTAEQLQAPNRYSIMAYCHGLAVAHAIRERAVLSVLSPDCIIADGGLHKGAALVQAGYRAILVTGPRAEMEAVRPLLMDKHRSSDCATLRIPARQLIALMVQNPHPISKRLVWGTRDFTNVPSGIYWPAGPSSLLAKFFHFHPLFVDLQDAPQTAAQQAGTVDGPLLRLAQIAEKDIYVVRDSDEIAVIELSRRDHDWMGGSDTLSPTYRVYNWAFGHAEPDHRKRFLEHNVRLKGDDKTDWDLVEKRVFKRTIFLRTLMYLASRSNLFLHGTRFIRYRLAAIASALRARRAKLMHVLCRPDLLHRILWHAGYYYQVRLAPELARRAGWIYWPFVKACELWDIRFLVNMPAGMGHNTVELDFFFRRKLANDLRKGARVVLFRFPNQMHRESVALYRRSFWWTPTSRIAFLFWLPMVMRYRHLTEDGGLSRLKWQLRQDGSYTRPYDGQTYLHQVSKQEALETWRKYARLRASTTSSAPLTTGLRPDRELLEFLGGYSHPLALVHIKLAVANATGAITKPESYLLGLDYLYSSGFKVVLVGREPMPKEFERYPMLNYAGSKLASYRHDLQIFSMASLVVTAGSGIAFVPDCMNIPYVYADSWHVGMPMFSPRCIIVPALVRDRQDGQFLTFAEQARLYWSLPDDGAESFPTTHYEARNASDDEILAAIKEALAPPDQNLTTLQRLYKQSDPKGLLDLTQARASNYFLRKHQHLLGCAVDTSRA